MEMKKESNILTEEKPKYIISLKKRYRILYIVMFVLFLVCTMYFGATSFCAGTTDTMIFGIGITVIFLIFWIAKGWNCTYIGAVWCYRIGFPWRKLYGRGF